MIHVDRTFKNETVVLDGDQFNNCRFEFCKIIYRGGPVQFTPPLQLTGCVWGFEGPAMATVQLLQLIGRNGSPQLIQDLFTTVLGPQN